jgi:hypothetical protein
MIKSIKWWHQKIPVMVCMGFKVKGIQLSSENMSQRVTVKRLSRQQLYKIRCLKMIVELAKPINKESLIILKFKLLIKIFKETLTLA